MSSIEDINLDPVEDEVAENIERLVSQMQLGEEAPAADMPEEPPAEPQPQQQPQLPQVVEEAPEPVQGIALQLYEFLGHIIEDLPDSAFPSNPGPSNPGPSFYQASPQPHGPFTRLTDVLGYWRSREQIAMIIGGMDSDSSDSE